MWQDNAHGALVLREAGGVGRWEERRERVAKGRRGLKRLIMPPMGCELMLARMRSDRAPAHGSELPPHATYIDIWAVRYTWTHGPCLRGRRQSACVLHCAAPCRAHTLRDLCLASTEQVDAKVEPTYIRVKAKKHTLQLLLPAEVLTDASTAQRSTTTGHLVLTCPKVQPRRRLSAAPHTASALHLHDICTAPARHLHGTCTAPARHLHGICTAPARHLHAAAYTLHTCTYTACACTLHAHCMYAACTLQVHPIVVSKAPQTTKAEPKPALNGGQEHGLLPTPSDNLKGAVDVRGIVLSAPTGQAKPKPHQEEISLGPDFSDEEDVPPLC